MADGVRCNRPLYVHSGDALDSTELVYGVDMSPMLPAAVNLSSVAAPTVNPAGITIANQAINALTVTDNDGTTTIAASKGVIFTKTGGVKGQTYDVTFAVTTAGNSVLKIIVPVVVQ